MTKKDIASSPEVTEGERATAVKREMMAIAAIIRTILMRKDIICVSPVFCDRYVKVLTPTHDRSYALTPVSAEVVEIIIPLVDKFHFFALLF